MAVAVAVVVAVAFGRPPPALDSSLFPRVEAPSGGASESAAAPPLAAASSQPRCGCVVAAAAGSVRQTHPSAHHPRRRDKLFHTLHYGKLNEGGRGGP